MKSIIWTKKSLGIALAAVVVTLTMSASAFMYDDTPAKGYERTQALGDANECGDGELPFNILCQNVASEIQGDENAVASTATQAAGTVEPYENLVDEATVQTVMEDETAQITNIRTTPDARQNAGVADVQGFSLPTPGAGN